MGQDRLKELETERAIAVLMEERAVAQAATSEPTAENAPPQRGADYVGDFGLSPEEIDHQDNRRLEPYSHRDKLASGYSLGLSVKAAAARDAALGIGPEGGLFEYDDDFSDRYEGNKKADFRREAQYDQKHPFLGPATEVAGSLVSLSNLANAGVTSAKALPQISKLAPEALKNFPRVAKFLGYGGKVVAGAADTAAISSVMAYGDDNDIYDAAKSGAKWGAAFTALPPAAKAVFKAAITEKIGKSAKDMFDKAGNFIPVHLAKGDHTKLKTLYRQYIGEGITGQPLINQQNKVVGAVQERMGKVVAHDTARGLKSLRANTVANRGAKLAEVKLKNATADTIEGMSAKNVARIAKDNSLKMLNAETKIAANSSKLQNKILNDAAPSAAVKITGTGTPAVKQLATSYENAYNVAWKPVNTLNPNTVASFAKDAKAIQKSLTMASDKAAVGNVISNFKNAATAGKDGLRTFDSSLRKGAYSAGVKGESELRDALLKLRSNFTEGLPEITQKGLAKLNLRYPNYLAVKDAANTAVGTKGVFTPTQLLNSVKKVGKGTASVGEAPLQQQALAMADDAAANISKIGALNNAQATQLASNTERAAAAKTATGRKLTGRASKAANARADTTSVLKKANAARTEAHTAPFKNELERLKVNSAIEGKGLPQKWATSAIAGVPGAALTSPLTGGVGAGFAAPLIGATQGKLLSTKGAQKFIYGHHPTQEWVRKQSENVADLLRGAKSTGLPTGLKQTTASSLAQPSDEDPMVKRLRTRNR